MKPMQEKQILQHTKQAVEQITPDCFDAIWERASQASKDEYPFPNNPLPSRKKKAVARTWITSLSVLAACILCFFGFQWYENYAVYTTINLDVNPSIQICINRQEEILSITGLNADGKKVVDALFSPKHRQLDEVVTETILELVNAGYLTTDEANAILVSVDTGDASNAEGLMEDLSQDISTAMGKEEVYGEIISQQIPRGDKEVERLAKELHISDGKATLIKNMALKNQDFSEKDLAAMRINEIVETARKESVDMSSFEQPAKFHDVPAPKKPSEPNGTEEKKKPSGNGEVSENTNSSNKNNNQNNTSQSNRTAKQESTNGSGKQYTVTNAPKATTAPKSDSDKKNQENQNQQNNQREPEGSQQRGENADRSESDNTSSTANPSVTSAPEPTSAAEDRRGHPEHTHYPDAPRYPRYPDYPEYPRYPDDEGRK